MDPEEHEFSREADFKRTLEKTERQAAWFPAKALVVLGVMWGIWAWRGEDVMLGLMIGIGIVLGMVGAEILKTRALILRIEYIRMRLLTKEQEREVEMARLEADISRRAATSDHGSSSGNPSV